jgi:hypothetical protein
VHPFQIARDMREEGKNDPPSQTRITRINQMPQMSLLQKFSFLTLRRQDAKKIKPFSEKRNFTFKKNENSAKNSKILATLRLCVENWAVCSELTMLKFVLRMP